MVENKLLHFFDKSYGKTDWCFFDLHYLLPCAFLLKQMEDLPTSSRILIIGDYAGRETPLLQSLGYTPDLFCLGKPSFLNDSHNFTLIQGNLDQEEDYSKISDTYDLIICYEVLEHLFNDHQALKFLRSRLRKSGKLIFSSPLNNLMLGKRAADFPTAHVQSFSLRQLTKLFDHSGFSPKQMIVRGWIINFWYSLPIRSAIWLFRKFFGNRTAFKLILHIAQTLISQGDKVIFNWLSMRTWAYGCLAVLHPAISQIDFNALNYKKFNT